jgi:hypothetical protein
VGDCPPNAKCVVQTPSGILSCFILLIGDTPLTSNKKAINLFVSSADHRYGPITTIRREGRILKHIPWSAFAFSEGDWERVKQAAEILDVRERPFPFL